MEKADKIQMFVDDAENLIYICEGASLTSDKLNEPNSESRKSDFIWTRKLQSEEDTKATEEMIDFLSTERISKALGDKKTHKTKVWEEVAAHLISCGYKMAENMKTASVKCHQKWRNLERSYTTYINHSSETSKGSKKPPPYFDKMHSILEKKHQQQPASTSTTVLLASGDEVLQNDMEVVAAERAAATASVGTIETLLIDGPNELGNREEPCGTALLGTGKLGAKQRTVDQEILRTLRNFKQDEERRFAILHKLLKENLEEKRNLNQALRQYLSSITNSRKKRKIDGDSI